MRVQVIPVWAATLRISIMQEIVAGIDEVNAIVEFLNSGPILFPNAIILALSPEIDFSQSRGPTPERMISVVR